MTGTPSHPRLIDLIDNPIAPPSAAAAKSVLADLKDLAADNPEIAECIARDTPARRFLTAALALSPYLRDLALSDPEALGRSLTHPVGDLVNAEIARARACWRQADGALASEAEVMTALRRAKRQVAMAVALADLARIITCYETTRFLSDLADASLGAAFDHLLSSDHAAGKFTLHDTDNPGQGSGLVVLGMGKHGAGELNYSSDIDIVVFFEAEAGIVADPQ
ncbi:MAG: bifunctional [glutamine synthetase] adenylyltransferase/[glutamine synthetase]-adenylyl-L-tyrosine phosphorylase, partial [Hoeflea sp.]